MSAYDIRATAAELDRFIADWDQLNAAEAEQRLLPILQQLLSIDGFGLIDSVRPESQATDYIAVGNREGRNVRVGVEYKHYAPTRPADTTAVDQVLALARRSQLEQVILISRSGFTAAALEAARRDYPIELQMLDVDGLRGWVVRLERALGGRQSRIVAAIEELSREAARAIASNPRELDHLEWRDLERMMAVVLDRLGFKATLTPAAKDGGKDIILELEDEQGMKRSYVVELKHWRSGQHVGHGRVKHFIQVVAREGHERGLFIATYDYTEDAFSALTEVERSKVKFGAEEKVVALCRTYVKAESGLWSPTQGAELPELLFQGTS
jgi:restriction system protein